MGISLVITDISDDYVSGFLTRFPEPWETPYKSVWAVKPGHFLLVHEGRIQERQYWGLSQDQEISYKKDEEYQEHFNALFEESIRCHTRTTHPVIAQLSGGLDSSSVVCVSDRLIRRGQSSARDLKTVSYVYDEARTSDERSFIRSVEDCIGKVGYHLREEDASCLSFAGDDSFISAPTFGHCFAERNGRLRQIIAKCGARILLTGQAGDQLLYSSDDPSPELADLMWKWRFLEFHKRTSTWSLVTKKPYLQHLWLATLLVVPYPLTAAFRYRAQVPAWINKSFAKRMNIRERLSTDRDIYECKLPSQRDQSRALSSTIAGLAASYYSEWLNIDVTHPFLYRPLVEFLQSLPPDQRLRPGETRSLMRRALRGVLPEKVVQRRGKQGPDEALYRAVVREWPRLRQLFSDALVCKRGYADRKTLLATLDRARHGAEEYTFKLLLTISLELWLRSFEKFSLNTRTNNRRSIINAIAWRDTTCDVDRNLVSQMET